MTDQSPVDERPGAVAALFVRHPLWEDALALLFGTALVALGIAFYAHAGLLTGGTVGIAFPVSYTHLDVYKRQAICTPTISSRPTCN